MAAPSPAGYQKQKRWRLPRLGWLIGAAAFGIALIVAIWRIGPWSPAHRTPDTLPGYVTDLAMVKREYAQAHGFLREDWGAIQNFDRATGLMRRHEYGAAIAVLEAVSKQAPLPSVFNNLGVLYAETQDRARAINAFREALAHDSNYQPVRFNLARLSGLGTLGPDAAGPVSQEVEPNNSSLAANPVAVDAAVDGEIRGTMNDEDWFRLTAPTPRDVLQIHVTNRSGALALGLGIYDEDIRLLAGGKQPRAPGASATFYLAPPAGSTFYVDLWGADGTSGAYTLSVKRMKDCDKYEPNDDIFNATGITPGQPVEANIMDASDTDFYRFVSPRTGTVTIDIENLSSTLIPALTMLAGDKRTIGFGTDVKTWGAGLRQIMDVRGGETYYLQVWSRGRTSGKYRLTVR